MSLIPARIDAVTLIVEDVRASARFYRETMGFDEVSSSDVVVRFQLENVKLSLVDKKLLLQEAYLDELPSAPGPVTLAVSVSAAEVDEYMARLEQAGVKIIAPAETKPVGIRIGFVADPDGHLWELIEAY